MAQKKKNIPSLSPSEWEVMKIVWDFGPIAARDVFSKLPDGHGWAYKTVKTLLSRLVAKEALDYDQVGNSYLYRAVAGRDEVTRVEVQSVFHRMVSEAVSPVLVQFIQQADLSNKEIDQLKKVLEAKRKKQKPGNSKRKGSS